MISVLHIIQSFNTGGAARVLLGVARLTNENSYRHRVLSLTPLSPDAVLLAHSSQIDVLHVSDWETCLSEISRADVIHVHWWNSPEMNVLLSQDLPPARIVCWYHVGGESVPQRIPDKLLQLFDINVACSEHTFRCGAFARAQKTNHVHKILAALDEQRIKTAQPKTHDGFVIGYNGTVHYQKMHRQFLSMASKVQIPNVRFEICGGGDVDGVRTEAGALGIQQKCHFRGYVADIENDLISWDVFGYPLCAETYAAAEIALQEAMYAGIPPVVFPHGGIPYLVQHEETGLIANSETEYVQALERLYQDSELRMRLSDGAKKFAREHFSLKRCAAQWKEIYGQVLDIEKRARAPLVRESRFSALNAVGAENFIDSLVDPILQDLFFESAAVSVGNPRVDALIAALPPVVHFGGILPYHRFYSDDLHIKRWHSLRDAHTVSNSH